MPDAIEFTDTGIRYARGVHVTSRRPDLRIISVNQHGEIGEEYVQAMSKPEGEATPQVIALIETGQALIQQQRLHEQEPWFEGVPIFIPPYEAPEAERTAIQYLLALKRRSDGSDEHPSDRGVHAIPSTTDDCTLLLIAVTSTGERIAERSFDVQTDSGETLLRLREELSNLLDLRDPLP